MWLPDLVPFSSWVTLIDLVGALVIAGYAAAALRALAQRRDVPAARFLVAEGAIAGLNFKVAGTLLKTVELQSWQQIGAFCAILALRTLLKWLFTWEQQHITLRQSTRSN